MRTSPVAEIHARFTYRMHDLSEFMKGLLIRFTRWFNRTHSRKGTLVGRTLQERDRGKRRGGADDGGLHRSQSGAGGNGEGSGGLSLEQLWGGRGRRDERQRKKAREGLVRACLCDQGVGFEAEKWRMFRVYIGD